MTTTATETTVNVEQNGAPESGGEPKGKGRGKAGKSATPRGSSSLDGLPQFGKPVNLAISDIHDDPAIGVRYGRPDPLKVEQYRDDMENGRQFPPIKVARYPDGKFYMIGGYHRRQAAIAIGQRDILSQVAEATPEQAFLLAIEDNRKHGVPMSPADKGLVVGRLIGGEDRYGVLGDRQIAELVGLSPTTVGLLRKQIKEGKSVEDINAERAASKKAAAKKIAKVKRAKAGKDEPAADNEDAEPAGDDSRDENDWSDDKYFSERVNPKLTDPGAGLKGARLKALKAEVARWRKVKAAREQFQTALVKAGVKQAVEAGTAGQWESEIYFALIQGGPNRWQLCGTCQGKGGDCCRNRGYHVPKTKARK